MIIFRRSFYLFLLIFVPLFGFFAQASEIPERHLRLFKPLPEAIESASNPITDAKVVLGRMLFFEPRLSRSHQVSCNSCHMLDKYGVDNAATSDGHRGLRGDRNSPTVYNAAGHFRQFWDGRAADVEEQSKGPVMNPVEMAMLSEQQVLDTLNSMPEYVSLFRKAFPKSNPAVTFDNFALAVGAFERKLVTPSKWDKFLAGDQTALSPAEKEGFLKFADAGCPACHMGAYLGGTTYQKLGIVKPWPNQTDPGRFNETKLETDKMFFKVPSLRNIAKTAPYFHNGQVATLDHSVELMAEHELGKKLSAGDVASIITFLNALTGELPRDYIKPPMLPKSTPQTPKPDLSE
ncbi:MAG: c-type cytochrome [Bryobacterales bacterium]|nr:c-type cytochrome [Bryobacterales bacterium]